MTQQDKDNQPFESAMAAALRKAGLVKPNNKPQENPKSNKDKENKSSQ